MRDLPTASGQTRPGLRGAANFDWQDPALGAKLDAMSRAERDQLTYGVIELDEEGVILSYNHTEGEISGRRPSEVIGRNLFLEVAPCLQSLRFYMPFRRTQGEQEQFDREHDYSLETKMGVRRVKVHMRRHPDSTRTWVLIKRL